MNPASLKALLAFLPFSFLLEGSAISYFREKTIPLLMEFVGAGCLELVVFAHICEALHLFPLMHWGAEHSAGHYLDLVCAIIGLVLFPTGYLLQALRLRG